MDETSINTFSAQFLQTMSVVAWAIAFSFVQLFPFQALAFTAQHDKNSSPLYFPLNHTFPTGGIPMRELLISGSLVRVIATAYTSLPELTDASPDITAAGTKTRPGIIAANFLPLYTKVRINDRTYVVEDRMNARYNEVYRVDIWLDSYNEAITFGARPVILEIISLPEEPN